MGELFLLNRCVTGKIKFQLLKQTSIHNTGTTTAVRPDDAVSSLDTGIFKLRLGDSSQMSLWTMI